MFGLIAAFVSTIMGIGSGMNSLVFPKTPDQTKKLNTYSFNACYNPDPTNKITLKWPDNFTNVSDPRPSLNPIYWGKTTLPATFTTDISCRAQTSGPMNGRDERTFVLITSNLPIPSCKTDELAGPGQTNSKEVCEDANIDPAIEKNKRHRGTCSVNDYPELRKIADAQKDGKKLEIFWNPFTHNVGCGFRQEYDNCGPGTRSNINLADFIYVLKGRDAYAPGFINNGCKPKIDASVPDNCTHQFDMYVAEDLYYRCLNQPTLAPNQPTPTPNFEDRCYFFNQVVRNCQVSTSFFPITKSVESMPPFFISRPFLSDAQVNDARSGSLSKIGRIVPDQNQTDVYHMYVWGDVGGNVILTKHLQALMNPQDKITGPFDYCPPEGGPTCMEPIGKIDLQNAKESAQFLVYSRRNDSQKFILIRNGEPNTSATIGYVYMPSTEPPPQNTSRNASLQLTSLNLAINNDWTWGTPVCKPAIYLYPEKEENVNVKLALDGTLTVSDPLYDSNKGWEVKAYPDGKLTTHNSPRQEGAQSLLGQPTTYPYLYYEADIQGITIPKEGWVLERSKLKDQILKILKQIGFNDKEIADFNEYWLPRLKDKPYYFITLMPEDTINAKEKLIFNKTPDTLIRTRVVFEGLDYPLSVTPLSDIPSHERKGFVVTDWGGTLIGKSCSEVGVK